MFDSVRPYGLYPARLLCPWDSPGKNTGVGCHALLQGIFPTQGSNPCLLSHLQWQAGSLPITPPGKPMTICNEGIKWCILSSSAPRLDPRDEAWGQSDKEPWSTRSRVEVWCSVCDGGEKDSLMGLMQWPRLWGWLQQSG